MSSSGTKRCLGASFFLCAFQAAPLLAGFEILPVFPDSRPPAAVEITVARLDGSDHQVRSIEPGRSLQLSLDLEGVWLISGRGDGWWGQPIEKAPGSEPARFEMAFLPAGSLTFSTMANVKETPSLTFAKSSGGPIARGELRCAPSERVWRCEVPAGRWNLRLALPGHVPRYFWDIPVEPGKNQNLGKQSFVPGASISGFVISEDREPAGAVIDAAPMAGLLDADPSQDSRRALTRASATADSRGFFQLTGLRPGAFRLLAAKAGALVGEAGPVTVTPAVESVLTEAIALRAPAKLALSIEPPQDPYGAGWNVELFEEVPAQQVLRSVARGSTSADGQWSTDQAHAGTWVIWLTDNRRNRWLVRELVWQPGDPSVFLNVPRQPVRGKVSRGDEPIVGALIFGSSSGERSFEMALDERGHYEGFLPEAGSWPVELLEANDFENSKVLGPFDIYPRAGKSFAELNISLPDTRISGNVVAHGSKVDGARILVLRYPENRRRDAFSRSRADGTFDITGLQPGKIKVRASHGDWESPWIDAELTEGDEVEVELVLEPRRHIQGQVFWSGGPVPGANVLALLGDGNMPRASTDFEGAFDLPVPGTTTSAVLVIAASGFDVAFRTQRLGDSKAAVFEELGQGGGVLSIRGLSSGHELRTEQAAVTFGSLFAFLEDRFEYSHEETLLKGLPAGRYEICSGRGGQPPCQIQTLPPGGKAEFSFDLED